MRKTFSFKLYSSKKNRALHNKINVAASVYNHCIALHDCYYRVFRKHLHKYALQKHLTKLMRMEKYAYWRTIGSNALQDITDRIELGYQLFFRNLKKRDKGNIKSQASPPSFKKYRKYKSITFKNAGYKVLESNKIRIGDEIFKYSKSRDIEGVIKTLTIKRNPLGEIFLFFSCELPEIQITRTMTGKSAGFDFGLKKFLTSSDGCDIDSPLFFFDSQKRIAQACKNLSRKKKGSSHQKESLFNVTRLQQRVVNKRNDYQFKLARKLVTNYDFLFFEDLNIAGMKRLWGKKISDLGFSSFMEKIRYLSSQTGAKVVTIDRFYPSSKTCHECLYIKPDLSIKERIWQCELCKSIHDRDRNAALNIFREGASSLGLGDIRPLERQSLLEARITHN